MSLTIPHHFSAITWMGHKPFDYSSVNFGWKPLYWGSPDASDGKESVHNVEDPGFIPVSGRSPGEGNGSPLQYSCLENPMDRGGWRAIVHGAAESDMPEQLTLSHFYLCADCLTSGYFVRISSQMCDDRVKGNETKSLRAERRGSLHAAVPGEDLWYTETTPLAMEVQARQGPRTCRYPRDDPLPHPISYFSASKLSPQGVKSLAILDHFIMAKNCKWLNHFWHFCHFWHMCKPSISLSESSPDGPDLARPSGSGLGLFIEIKLHHDTEDGMARWLAAQLEGRLCSSGVQEPERAPPSPSADYT